MIMLRLYGHVDENRIEHCASFLVSDNRFFAICEGLICIVRCRTRFFLTHVHIEI